MHKGPIQIGRAHALAANLCTELEDWVGDKRLGLTGVVGGGAGPASAPANEMSPSPVVFNWKEGNDSADVSTLQLPREGG